MPQIVASEVLCLSQDLLPHLQWFNFIACQTYILLYRNKCYRGPSTKFWYKYPVPCLQRSPCSTDRAVWLTPCVSKSPFRGAVIDLDKVSLPDNRGIKQSLVPCIPYLPAHSSWTVSCQPAPRRASDFLPRRPLHRISRSAAYRIHSKSSWVMKSCWCILPQKRYRLCKHAKRSCFDTIQSWL